ncbi:MAG: tetratricopeptide repeat protein [Spirochaetia bacterium]|nr:tetratricopeptide repeat protein [Spirochaetia bacterium]
MSRPRFLAPALIAGASILFASQLAAQASSDLQLSLVPTVAVPIGPTLEDGLPFYGIGGGGGLEGELVPGFLPFTMLRFGVDAELLPINRSEGGLTLVAAGGGLGARFRAGARFTFKAWGGGGIYMGMVEAGTVRNPFWEAGAGIGLRLGPTLELTLGGRYRDFLTPTGSLYRGVSIAAGVGYDLAGARKGGSIRMEPSLRPIFPLFYTWYDDNPAGELVLRNDESSPLEKVKVSFEVKQYMDGPRVCAELPRLAPGASASVPVFALFNDQIFRVTEGTKSAGEIVVEYFYLGSARTARYPVTVTVNNRNAMTWDDDRKAAAFVAAKNPLVLAFSKSVASAARRTGSGTATTEIRTALGLLEALRVHGLGYVVDPATPYEKLAESDTAVDFLQFPQQTLAYKAGDCDDLSVLYAALLEAAGIRSAFVLVPGHVYVAFDSGLSPDAARRLFANPSEWVEREGTAWIPVEVTLVADGFLKSWRTGAREWREAERDATLAFFETRKAWELYEPVGIADEGVAVMLPDSARVQAAYEAELARFVSDQTSGRIAALTAAIGASGGSEVDLNRLGILYAQFGQYDEAEARFVEALGRRENLASLVNLGNISYLRDESREAVGWYERALKLSPESGVALLGLARALYELEDFSALESAVAKLKAVSPELAARLELPGASTARASDAAEKEIDTWTE